MKRGGAGKSPHWLEIGIAGQIGLWLVDLPAIYIYSNVWLQRLQHAKTSKNLGFYTVDISNTCLKKGCCLDPTNTRGHYIVGCKTVGPRDHVSSWVMLSQVAAFVDLQIGLAVCVKKARFERQKIRSFSLLWRWQKTASGSDVEMSDRDVTDGDAKGKSWKDAKRCQKKAMTRTTNIKSNRCLEKELSSAAGKSHHFTSSRKRCQIRKESWERCPEKDSSRE